MPFAFSVFWVATTVVQIFGAGFGFGGAVGVGGVTGAVTTVCACAVLSAVFVSGVVVDTVAMFVFVPVVLTVALIVIVAAAPAARLEIVQSSASAVVVQLPADAVADRKVTLAGAASATFTFAAVLGPALETTSV